VDDLETMLKNADTLITDIDALAGKVGTTEAEDEKTKVAKTLKAKEAEWGELKGKIEAAQLQLERKRVIADARRNMAIVPTADVGIGPDPTTPAKAKDHAVIYQNKRRLFRDYMMGKTLSGEEAKLMAPRSENFKEGADGVVMPIHMSAKLFGKQFARAMMEAKTMLSSNAGDASLIPQEFVQQILELPSEGTSLMNWVNIVPCQTGTLTIPRLIQTDANEFGGVSFSWISEGVQKPETEPDFQQITIDTHELAGYTEVSLRMLSRSVFDLEAYLTNLYRAAMQDTLTNVIINGSGVGQPLGVINTTTIRTVPRAAAGLVGYSDLVRLKHQLQSYHRGNAKWVADATAVERLELLTDAQTRPVFRATIADAQYDRMIGYPYLETERAPNVGTAGDIIFADWSWYWLVVEEEVVIKRSDHFKFRNNLAAFVAYAVIGGRPVEPRVFAILDDAS